MRVLVTGANGFLGRNLTEYLKDKYFLLTPTRKELDLLDEEAVKLFLLTHTPDHIIHCAKADGEGSLGENLRMFLNVQKYHKLLCSGKMIYFGSGAEFDRKNWHGEMSEEYFDDSIPTDDYGLAKYCMNRITMMESNIYNLRLFGVFGKYEERSERFISTCCKNILTYQPIIIQKNLKFDYLYVNDLCPIVEWFLTHIPLYRDYNVCTGHLRYLKDIAIRLLEVTDTAALIKDEGRKMDYEEYGGQNGRLLFECPVNFTPFDVALKEMYEYYKTQLSVKEGS